MVSEVTFDSGKAADLSRCASRACLAPLRTRTRGGLAKRSQESLISFPSETWSRPRGNWADINLYAFRGLAELTEKERRGAGKRDAAARHLISRDPSSLARPFRDSPQ